MPSPAKKRDTGCPFAFALDTFGDRWTLLVVRDLMFRGKTTYGEFLDSAEGVATNVLADRLKYLEEEGIIDKSRDPENRRRNIYTLTEKGVELTPIMLEVVRWSAKHDPHTAVPKPFLKRIKTDRDALLAEIRAKFIKS